MADGRILKRKITKSKKLAALKSDKARLLWFYMLPFTDVEGRLEADPEDLRDEIIRKQRKGFTLQAIENCLQDLHRVGLITLYETDDKRYLEYGNFHGEQNLRRDKEAKSEIPAPLPDQSRTTPAAPTLYLSNSNIHSDSNRRRFTPPTLAEVQAYIDSDPEDLSCVNANDFYKAYATTDPPWHDIYGNAVKNWKLKLRTWANKNRKEKSNADSDGSFAEQKSVIGEVIDD
jgi:hypothetical protein